MTYQVSSTEGKTITLSLDQAERYESGAGWDVLGEVAGNLPAGEYSVYLPDGGPLLENITVS